MHGWQVEFPPAFTDFVSSYISNYKEIAKTGEPTFYSNAMPDTSIKFPMVMLDTTLQEKAKTTLVTYVVASVLQERLACTKRLALLILAFEHDVKNMCTEGYDDIERKYDIFKATDLKMSGDCDIVKFISKRSLCTCLEPNLAELRRTQPVIRICWHCAEKKDIKKLKA